MSGSNVLLDTNIISALLKGDVSVADEIDKSSKVYLSATVVGELFYGAQIFYTNRKQHQEYK